MDNETKIKFPLWMYPGTQKRVKDLMKEANCRSQSEFIEKAILFYSGYVAAENSLAYLPVVLSNALTGTVQTSENRLARLLFKLAVEMCMMMHVVAETTELPDNYLDRLRGRCVKEVKKSIGTVRFDNAFQSHDELNEEIGEP